MAFQLTDSLILERGGVHYKDTVTALQTALTIPSANDNAFAAAWNGDTTGLASRNAVYDQFIVLDNKIDALGTNEHTAADITARDALPNLVVGDKIFVTDASADATVATGWAIYRLASTGPDVFTKMAEQESLDITITALNLNYTASPTQGVVTTDGTGLDATLPAVTGVNAGLMLPADKTKSDFISVTQAVDLDAIETASHAEVTTAGSATTNPIVVTGQELSFNIAALTTAP